MPVSHHEQGCRKAPRRGPLLAHEQITDAHDRVDAGPPSQPRSTLRSAIGRLGVSVEV
jgi:hypothetical protein